MNIWIMNHYANTTFFDKGGRHYYFAKYLRLKGHNPVIFCANAMHGTGRCYFDDDRLWRELTQENIGVPYVFVKSRPYVGNGKDRLLCMKDFYKNLKATVKEYAKKNARPDIIYASSVHPLTLLAGIQIAKQYGVKCVCEVRDLWPESFIAYGILQANSPIVRILRFFERRLYKNADALIFTMEGGYDYIVDQGWEKDVPKEKVYYINNGIDLEQFCYNMDHYQIEDADLQDKTAFKVVYTGSIRRVNNLGILLDAAKRVTSRKIRFLIWGDGDELELLKKRVLEEGIQNVLFKGRVQKEYIPYIVSCADLNILPGTTESIFRFGISPNKMFDYLASGKPQLVTFRARYNPVEKYDAGITMEDADVDSIARAVEAVLSMPASEYQKLCENAEAAAHCYDFAKLTERLLSVFSSMITNGRQNSGMGGV